MSAASYRSRTFIVEDADARLRTGSTLQDFVTGADGKPRTIAKGKTIRVEDIKVFPVGTKSANIFLDARDAESGAMLGWTSSTNVAGKFYSETIGLVKAPPGGNRFGPHAAWQLGQYLGQIDLVRIVGTGYEIKHVSASSSDEFIALLRAAQAAGRTLRLNSGFRSYPEQAHYYDGYRRKLPGFNRAAPAGRSNHQNGVAFDLDVKPGDGNPNYEWLKKHATSHGFLRTVSDEPWHWEYLPAKAAAAKAAGKFHTW